ncbi:MAG: hypothetical protein LBI35_06505 [Burkholderiales bacterium]|jgi:hypothetical protein|nr:hypothetical protein [Burkholderiales bacterium]
MLTFKRIAVTFVTAEKSALAKTGIGTLGTWVSAHEIQIYVGVATLIFLTMQIIVWIPKVQSALRQMKVERERKKAHDALNFGSFSIPGKQKPKKRETLMDKIRRFFRVGR